MEKSLMKNNPILSILGRGKSITLPPFPQNPEVIIKSMESLVEVSKALVEEKKLESQHVKAMTEIEHINNRWHRVIHIRVSERENFHDSLKAQIEKSEEFSEKLALYRIWLDSLKQPLVTPEEVNPRR